MLFEEEDAALLKKWIIKRLEDMYVSPPASCALLCCAVLRNGGDVNVEKIVLTPIRMFWQITCLPY